ncbi:MAG: Dabb family protein [Deltaproteobacteria bacterium]|nr:Dabb family protein [Deltaproteobacteria bacterium]
MIRHIVFFKFKDNATEADQQGLIDDLLALKDKIPLIKELEVGTDVAKKPNSFDLALNSVFNTLAEVGEYAVHPEHVLVVEKVNALCKERASVDFEF